MLGCSGQVTQGLLISASLSRALTLSLILSFCSAFHASAALADDESILLDREDFACVVSHFSEYTELQGNQVVVAVLGNCPDPTVTMNDISKLAVAMSPTIETKSENAETQPVISFNAQEIDCILSKQVDFLNLIPDVQVIELRSLLSEVCR